jgi:hypothetical protein
LRRQVAYLGSFLPMGARSWGARLSGSRASRSHEALRFIAVFSVQLVATTMFAWFATSSSVAHAQVQPDDVINPAKAEKVKDLVSPGVYLRVKNGLAMKIAETQAIEWPPPYKAATDANAAKVSLVDHRTISGYVAGLPFPNIDPNDPDAAIKAVWNMQFRPVVSDDYDLRFVDCDFGYTKEGKQGEALESIQVGHYAGYNMAGRTEVQPMPTDPDFQSNGRYWLFGLYPALAPAELRGAGLIRTRFAAPDKSDEIWAFTPDDRHVREIGEEMMNNPGGIGQWSPDRFAGFDAKVQNYDYKFLGHKGMLASVNANSPKSKCVEDGTAGCADNWEMRQIDIVEASPRTGTSDAGGAKIDIYIDTEIWFPPYVDTYNSAGELTQTSIYSLANRDRTTDDATVAVYPFKRSFMVSAETQDLKQGTLIKCYFPGSDTPDREGWYINMGTVQKEFFLTESMVRAAR